MFKIYEDLKSHKVFGIPLGAFLEVFGFFLFTFLIAYFFGIKDRWLSSPIHPFWIIILLVTVQYGAPMGMITVVLSTLFLLVGNIPPQHPEENYFDYQFRIYARPFGWLITTLVLGELISRKQRKYEELSRNYEIADRQSKEITRGYEQLRATKERLESRLASQLRSSVTTYQTLQILEELKPAKILLGLEKVVKTIMNPQKFSIYSLGSNGLEAITDFGWSKEDKYLRRFPTDSALFIKLIGEKKLLCVLNREDQKILDLEGVLAAPLIDPQNGTIIGMLKIEELDIEDLNLSNIESFRLICESAGLAYSHAMAYQNMERNAMEDPRFHVATAKMMAREANYLSHIAQGVDFPLASIRITLKEELIGQEHLLSAVKEVKEVTQTTLGPLARLYLGRGTVFILIVPFIEGSSFESSIGLFKNELQIKLGKEAIDVEVDWLHRPDKIVNQL